MRAVRTRTNFESHRKLKNFLRTSYLMLALLAGCKSPAPSLKSEFKSDRMPQAAEASQANSHDPAQVLDDGHTEAFSSSLKDLTAPAPKKDKNVLTLNQLSIDKLLLKAEESAKHGRNDEVKKTYQEVLRRQPEQPVAHHRLAILADNEGDFRTAEVHYRAALKSKASDPDLLSDVGYSYLLQTDYLQSEQYLREALGIQSDHKHALNNLALLYSLKGDFDATAEVLRRANSEQDVETKLAKLFPNGRPKSGSEDTATASASSSALQAPELRPIQPPPSAPDGGRAAANTAVAASMPPTDSKIPTASFTGHVSPDLNTAPRSQPDIVEQVDTSNRAVSAVYSAGAPVHANLQNAVVVQDHATQPGGQPVTNWNRVPISFTGGTPNSVVPAEMQRHANAPISAPIVSHVATKPAGLDNPTTPPQPTGRDPLETMPVWPNSSSAQSTAPSTANQPTTSPINRVPINRNIGSTPTPAIPISDAQRSAFILGMNCAPGGLFPLVDYGPQTSLTASSSSIDSRPTSAYVEQPASTVPSSYSGQLNDIAPIQQAPYTSMKIEARPESVQPRAVQYGAPQYPSTTAGRSGANSPGSLPQTTAPARHTSTYPGDSFQAMP